MAGYQASEELFNRPVYPDSTGLVPVSTGALPDAKGTEISDFSFVPTSRNKGKGLRPAEIGTLNYRLMLPCAK